MPAMRKLVSDDVMSRVSDAIDAISVDPEAPRKGKDWEQ